MKTITKIAAMVGAAAAGTAVLACVKKPSSVYTNHPEEKNPLEGKMVRFVENDQEKENADGVKGHLEAVGPAIHNPGIYEKYVKRGLDVVLSFGGLVALSPVLLGISAAIVVDDPGPVLFTQKRIGQNKQYFKLHKFRSMKMSTPHNVPTHMLENPEQYITRVGKFIRAHSLDELPQIWDIFIGNMSVIGPRPGLWNQDLLTAERDKYGANDIKPGLTGWAQINGRDELEIPVKAQMDGEYKKQLGLKMDIKCFFESLGVFAKDDSVVEGGTGEFKRTENAKLNEGKSIIVGQHLTEIGSINTGKTPRDKKRILFLAQHFITLYSFRRELIEKLRKEGHEVFLSLPESDDNKYFEELGCKIVPTEIDRRGVNPANDLKLIAFYCKMIPEINPDIIFSYTIKPNVYGTMVTNNKYKQVCNVTGTGGTFLEENLVAKICRVLYRHSVKHCYKVFFQNTGDRDLFMKHGMVKDNWDMLPGSGVNLEQFSLSPLPEGSIINFIFIGRVMKLKGIDEFLEAAKRTKENYTNTNFYIAGFIEDEEYKEKVASYGDAVIPLGFQKDIVSWIKRCHCTILPSHGGEGVPNVILESAAMGRICIGSNVPGTADVIEDGKTGYLFEAGNVDSLVEAIEKVMKMEVEARREMGIAGRAKVEKEFDREIVIKKYMDEVEKA